MRLQVHSGMSINWKLAHAQDQHEALELSTSPITNPHPLTSNALKYVDYQVLL